MKRRAVRAHPGRAPDTALPGGCLRLRRIECGEVRQ